MNCFLAICKDSPHDPDGFYYTVYYVNASDTVIENLTFESDAYVSDDDDLIQTSKNRRLLGKVPRKGYVKVEEDDEGSFDYTINFNFKITYLSRKTEHKSFTVSKYIQNGKEYSCLPVINKPGYMIEEN